MRAFDRWGVTVKIRGRVIVPLPEPTLSAASGLIGRRGREHPSYARKLAGLFPLSPSALPSLRFGAVETTPP